MIRGQELQGGPRQEACGGNLLEAPGLLVRRQGVQPTKMLDELVEASPPEGRGSGPRRIGKDGRDFGSELTRRPAARAGTSSGTDDRFPVEEEPLRIRADGLGAEQGDGEAMQLPGKRS